MPKTWTVDVGEDSSGELVINLPVDILNQMGWDDGTSLLWEDNNNGSWSLRSNEDSDNGSTGIR